MLATNLAVKSENMHWKEKQPFYHNTNKQQQTAEPVANQTIMLQHSTTNKFQTTQQTTCDNRQGL